MMQTSSGCRACGGGGREADVAIACRQVTGYAPPTHRSAPNQAASDDLRSHRESCRRSRPKWAIGRRRSAPARPPFTLQTPTSTAPTSTPASAFPRKRPAASPVMPASWRCRGDPMASSWTSAAAPGPSHPSSAGRFTCGMAAAASPAALPASAKPTTSRTWPKGARRPPPKPLLLCRNHHRILHEGDWTLSLTREGYPVFRNPLGLEARLPGNFHLKQRGACFPKWRMPARGHIAFRSDTRARTPLHSLEDFLGLTRGTSLAYAELW